jgi:hypothetical protein
VIVLDENVFESQRIQLSRWRIHLCQIGRDIARKGILDDAIIPLLRQLRRPTFVSRDRDFFDKQLCNDRFCLAFLDVRPIEVADYVRRFLRHSEFKKWSQRKGSVVRVSSSGVIVWRANASDATRFRWER